VSEYSPQHRAALRQVSRDSSIVLMGSALATVATFATSVLVTRSLSTDGAGVVFAAMSLFLLLFTLTKLGTGVGTVRMLSRYRALGEQHRLWPSLRAAFVPVLGLSTATGVGLAVAAPWVSEVVLGSGEDAVGAVRVLAALLPLAAISDLTVAAARGLDTVAPLVTLEKVLRPLLQLILVGAAATLAVPAEGVLIIWALPYALTAALGLAWLTRLTRDDIERARIGAEARRANEWREFWGFTWSRSFGVMTQILLKRIDLILLSALRGPAEAAIYAAASRFMVVGQLIGTSFAASIQPRLGRHVALGEYDTVRVLYQVAAVWLVVTAWPLYVMMAVWSPLLLTVFGEAYSDGAGALVVLSAAMLLATAVGPVDQVLIMSGKPTWVLGNSVVALLVNVALNLVLIPEIGALGAALAWALSILIANLLPLFQLYRWQHLHPISPSLGLASLLALGSFGVPSALVLLLVGQSWLGLVVAGAIGSLSYLGVLWRYGDTLHLDSSPLARFLPTKP
jgi:O-antigen/teichoic acid export membrane protein